MSDRRLVTNPIDPHHFVKMNDSWRDHLKCKPIDRIQHVDTSADHVLETDRVHERTGLGPNNQGLASENPHSAIHSQAPGTREVKTLDREPLRRAARCWCAGKRPLNSIENSHFITPDSFEQIDQVV